MTRNNIGLFKSCNWNEYNLNPFRRIHWKGGLVPVAAIIPTPIAYIKIGAVRKLVVEFQDGKAGPPQCGLLVGLFFFAKTACALN